MSHPYKRKGSRNWYIAPSINGIQVPQSSGTGDYTEAGKKLKILEGKIASGAPITASTDRDSFADLLELVRIDYKIKRRRSLYDLAKRIDVNLVPALGHLPAGTAWREIETYEVARQEAGAQNGTINRELAIIRRAYRLGERKGLVSHIPHIEMLPEESDRAGYYSKAQFALVLQYATPLLRNIMTVAYVTGWRLRSILRLEWRQVDLHEGFVWLNAADTKNRKATRWPLDQMGLREVFEEQRRDGMKDAIIPFVFHRDGRPVKDIRKSFRNACDAAGLDYKFHDFRGTAIVNLLEAGADTCTIMNMVGLKSERMVIHYAKMRGMREDRLKEVGQLLQIRMKGQEKKEERSGGQYL